MRYLSLAIVCLLPAVVQGQSIVVSGGSRSFVASGRQPAAVITVQDADKAAPVDPDTSAVEELRREIELLKQQLLAKPKPPEPVPVAVPKPVAAKPQPLKMQWNIAGNWNPTESETRKHLESVHGASAEGLTHQQMLDLHDSLHNGTSKSKAVVKTQSVNSACPGGVCPTPNRVAKNRRRR